MSIHRSDHCWSGLFPDLAIKCLMRNLKTTGNLTRGRDLLLSMRAAQRGH